MDHFDKPYECLCEDCISSIFTDPKHRIDTLYFDEELELKDKWLLITQITKELDKKNEKELIVSLAKIYSIFVSDYFFYEIDSLRTVVEKTFTKIYDNSMTLTELNKVLIILCKIGLNPTW